MIVEELIELLKQLPPYLPVARADSESGNTLVVKVEGTKDYCGHDIAKLE